ncbi:MAG TPA: valine--tRNA ligase [Alphaproteobacteria bacterium]|nr:valine--tRNA ligase [Alphaproteobacteria bacterium]
MLDKYDAQTAEQKHYQNWLEKKYFEPKMNDKEGFAIMMPPPNVTGSLHLGHALDNTLPDILTRRARMRGLDAIYQPGKDHAGIATQMKVVEKLANEGISKDDLGREEFLKEVWKWKEESGDTISNQMQKLGVSAAWDREKFTMDEDLSEAVHEVFTKLYAKGLIYKGNRLVNWDTVLQTAISDIEVNHKEVKGSFWYIEYPIKDSDEKLIIATTRPETMLGDTALAVNPNDERFKHLIGKFAILPLVGREIIIVGDEHADMEKGTGALKITPAHDHNDFEVGKRHNLEMINILNKDGSINANGGKYEGLDRFDARKQIIADLEESGQLVKTEDHTHEVGFAERGGQIAEPFLTEQWYVKTQPLVDNILKAIDNEEVEFVPANQKKIALNWLTNNQDWCISRQLWWGHQIPAWYNPEDKTDIFVGKEEDAPADWVRDEDVLDTWFSSALWPMATQGWPHKTPEMDKFYPGHAIMPGVDILFFWVIRMLMMSIEFTGKVPFKTIYLHALVLDGNGQKMSKSKGNGIDPLDVVNEYGADVLRYTLATQAAPGQNLRVSPTLLNGSRNFSTKLFNASKYAMMNDATFDPEFTDKDVNHELNKWILAEFSKALKEANAGLDTFRFNDYCAGVYNFTWNILCDWYLELTKPIMQGDDEALKVETRKTLGMILEATLKLIHPVMPFITEEIWQELTAGKAGESIMIASWPEAFAIDTTAQKEINILVDVVSAIRALRSEVKVPVKEKFAGFTRSANPEQQAIVNKYQSTIEFLAKIISLKPIDRDTTKTDGITVVDGFEIILPLEGIVDFEAEKKRLEKEIAKVQIEANKLSGMLNNEKFISKAKPELVEQRKAEYAKVEADLNKLKAVLENM